MKDREKIQIYNMRYYT